MDELRIRTLVAELDAAVPREGALLRLTDSAADDDGCLTATGNATGTLRLGIDLLAASIVAMDRAAAGTPATSAASLDTWADGDSDWSTIAVKLADPLPPLVRAHPDTPILGDRPLPGGYVLLVFAAIVGAFALGIIVASR